MLQIIYLKKYSTIKIKAKNYLNPNDSPSSRFYGQPKYKNQ